MAQQTLHRPRSAGRPRPPRVPLPIGRSMTVHSADGTNIHAEVFGPRDGYPIVLCHGITCALRVWHNQINDLSADHRVIAFDHRGHGQSGRPGRGGYTLDRLADDLDAVLRQTLRPGERATIAGHSMGGITIAAWADRYRHVVARRADAVALINTTTGDLIRELNLLNVPEALAAARIQFARGVIRAVGSLPIPRHVQWTSKHFVSLMAVGSDCDPEITALVHELFTTTSPAARGRCVRMLADSLGSHHIDLDALTVPALVIGSEKDRLLPIGQSRRIAEHLPNLAGLVELSGGHCAILERPAEVNRHLRELVAHSTTGRHAATS